MYITKRKILSIGCNVEMDGLCLHFCILVRICGRFGRCFFKNLGWVGMLLDGFASYTDGSDGYPGRSWRFLALHCDMPRFVLGCLFVEVVYLDKHFVRLSLKFNENILSVDTLKSNGNHPVKIPDSL